MDTWASPLATCGPPEKNLRIKKIIGLKTAPHDRDGFGTSEGGMDSKERRGMRGAGAGGHLNKRRFQKSTAGWGQGRDIGTSDGLKRAEHGVDRVGALEEAMDSK